MPRRRGFDIPAGTNMGGATTSVNERIEERLSPLLGPFTAKMAIKTFAVSKVGVPPDQLTRSHVPALLDALRPMLNTLVGSAKAQTVIDDLRKELA